MTYGFLLAVHTNMVNETFDQESRCFLEATVLSTREVFCMARQRIMSDRLKEEIAKELGFYDVVEREGWGGIRSRDAGNMVKYAVEMAQKQLAGQSMQKTQK